MRQLDRQRDKNIDDQTKEQIKQTKSELKRKSKTEHKIRRRILVKAVKVKEMQETKTNIFYSNNISVQSYMVEF